MTQQSGEITKRSPLSELTELSGRIQELLDSAEAEDRPTLEKALGRIEADWLTKVENCFSLLQWRKVRTEALSGEIKRLQSVKKRLESDSEWLEQYLIENMEGKNEPGLKFPLVSGTITLNPPSVIVEDEKAVPSQYLKMVVTYDVNKVAILNDYKADPEKPISGVKIVRRKRLVIK